MGLPLGYEAKGYFDGPKVIFRSFISRQYIEWIGRITRTSGSIDSQTRLVYAYAEVMNPYDKNPPLAIGTYVDAEIEGNFISCLLYTSPSPRDGLLSRMPSSA